MKKKGGGWGDLHSFRLNTGQVNDVQGQNFYSRTR